MSMFALKKDEIDECSDFQLGRYISTNEDMWKTLEFNIHEHYPATIRCTFRKSRICLLR